MSFHNRSDALIELLEELTQEGHEYVLVGGYLNKERITAGMNPR
jgi:glutathione synthase/RimK-type ligase-like ATP-grasp enzyme